MSLYITEYEMISRFSESLKEAASISKQFSIVESVQKPGLFVDFISAVKVAAGSSHQIAHTQENPNFLTIRDMLEGIIEVSQNLPTFTGNQAPLWDSIEKSLLQIADKGHRMATSRAMKRIDVLTNLNLREMKNRPEVRG